MFVRGPVRVVSRQCLLPLSWDPHFECCKLTPSDPSDLNLDLYCTELLVEIETVLETLPEGDLDEDIVYRHCERHAPLKDEDD